MALKSANGWPLIEDGYSDELHTWQIPAKSGAFPIRLRRGPAGFLLAVLLLWFAEVIEKVKGPVLDDWGWAPPRPIRGQTTGYSNHSSGTAADANALQHPLGKGGTFSPTEVAKIHAYLAFLGGTVRGGLDYRNRKDAMHWEINVGFDAAAKTAKRVARFPRGKRILKANPSQVKWVRP